MTGEYILVMGYSSLSYCIVVLTRSQVKSKCDAGEEGETGEVAEAGGDGRGHVVGIDVTLPRQEHYPDHDETCGHERGK